MLGCLSKKQEVEEVLWIDRDSGEEAEVIKALSNMVMV